MRHDIRQTNAATNTLLRTRHVGRLIALVVAATMGLAISAMAQGNPPPSTPPPTTLPLPTHPDASTKAHATTSGEVDSGVLNGYWHDGYGGWMLVETTGQTAAVNALSEHLRSAWHTGIGRIEGQGIEGFVRSRLGLQSTPERGHFTHDGRRIQWESGAVWHFAGAQPQILPPELRPATNIFPLTGYWIDQDGRVLSLQLQGPQLILAARSAELREWWHSARGTIHGDRITDLIHTRNGLASAPQEASIDSNRRTIRFPDGSTWNFLGSTEADLPPALRTIILPIAGFWRGAQGRFMHVSVEGSLLSANMLDPGLGQVVETASGGIVGQSIPELTRSRNGQLFAIANGVIAADGRRISWNDNTSWTFIGTDPALLPPQFQPRTTPSIGYWQDTEGGFLRLDIIDDGIQAASVCPRMRAKWDAASGSVIGRAIPELTLVRHEQIVGALSGFVHPDGAQVEWSDGDRWRFLGPSTNALPPALRPVLMPLPGFWTDSRGGFLQISHRPAIPVPGAQSPGPGSLEFLAICPQAQQRWSGAHGVIAGNEIHDLAFELAGARPAADSLGQGVVGGDRNFIQWSDGTEWTYLGDQPGILPAALRGGYPFTPIQSTAELVGVFQVLRHIDDLLVYELRILNQGALPSGPFDVQFYLSKDRVLDVFDLPFEVQRFPGIEAGQEIMIPARKVFPREEIRGFRVIAYIDSTNTVLELDDNNNLAVGAYRFKKKNDPDWDGF